MREYQILLSGPPLKKKNQKLYNSIDQRNRRTAHGRSGRKYTSTVIVVVPWERYCEIIPAEATHLQTSMITHPAHLFVHFLFSYFPYQSPELLRKTCQQCKVFCGNQNGSPTVILRWHGGATRSRNKGLFRYLVADAGSGSYQAFIWRAPRYAKFPLDNRIQVSPGK